MYNDLAAKLLAEVADLKTMIRQQKTVFTPKEAAEYMGIALSTLYKMTSSGILPFSKPNGKLIYFSREALDSFLLSGETETEEGTDIQAATYLSTHTH